MMLAVEHHVSISIGGLLVGLLLGALAYILGVWLAGETGVPVLRAVGAIIGVLIFIVLGFHFY